MSSTSGDAGVREGVYWGWHRALERIAEMASGGSPLLMAEIRRVAREAADAK